jgi:4-hydroxythreonine-4-phosphate dehydrogenase
LGDVAGIGPEIIAKSWPELCTLCRPVVVGDSIWMRRAVDLAGSRLAVREIADIQEACFAPDEIDCLRSTDVDLRNVRPGQVSAPAGRAAYDFLCAAIDLTLAGHAEGIVTAPLHKSGLHAAGLHVPGHTEILAARTNTANHAMLLYGNGLSVIHVTLHVALHEVFFKLTTVGILEKIRLLDCWLPRLLNRRPRVGVAALNPHAGDGGLFGDEEACIIEPAVGQARKEGIDVTGPWPCDTLFVNARDGRFDGIVAMYHDQGHIAMKLLGIGRLVNVTVGLPIVRTSVAHGTAYDIAWQGRADPSSLVEAARVAVRLVANRTTCVGRSAPE